jgi:hypothetical protein
MSETKIKDACVRGETIPSSQFKVSDKSELTIPLRNLVGLILFIGVAITGYFSLTERITFLEHNAELRDVHVKSNSEFRIKWPRGELGALPDDAAQNMRLDLLEKQIEKIYKEHEDHMRQLNGTK